MAKPKIEYTPEELNRPTNYIAVVGDFTKCNGFLIDLYEMQNYISQHSRKVLIIDQPDVDFYGIYEALKFTEIKEASYTHVMNLTKPMIYTAKAEGKKRSEVIEVVKTRFKMGLIVMNFGESSDFDALAAINGTGVDILVHRGQVENLSEAEIKRTDYLRIHINSKFQFNGNTLISLAEKYPDNSCMGIMIAQKIVNDQFAIVQKAAKEQMDEYGKEEWKKVVDQNELTLQAANFVYFDLKKDKIIGCNRDSFDKNIRELMELLGIPEEKYDLKRFAENYL